ncbi:Hypothetical protein CINCED_3A021771 [Cinara cedri]|nr:Hypothetical protein CINCED_3A021771 [Cinara cedri]
MTTVIVFGVFDNYTYAIIDYEPDVCMEKLQSISHNTNQNISTEPDFNCIHYRGMSMKPSTDHGYEMLFQGYIQASLEFEMLLLALLWS